MLNLIRFELKKICSRKIVWIGFALLLFFNIMLYRSYSLPSMSVWPDENSEYLYGAEAVEFDKAIAERYEGELTDEKVQEMLSDFAPSQSFRERTGGMNVAAIPMNSMQVAVQSQFANYDGTWNGLTVQDVYGDSSIQVGYNTGWLNTCYYMVQVIIGIGFLLIVAISPVFSGEYSGMDALILTSRYGKTKCVSAKVISAFTTAFLITSVFLILNIAVSVISFSTDGLSASVSFAASNRFDTLPVDMSCKTLVIMQCLLAFTSIFGATAITLFVSAVSRNTFVALAFAAVIHVFPLVIPVSEYSPIYRYLLLFPVYQGQSLFLLSLGGISLFGGSIPYAIIAIPVMLVLTVIGYTLSKGVFSNHQIA